MPISQRDADLTRPGSLQGPPAGYFVVVPPAAADDELGFSKLVATVAESWRLLLAACVLGGIAGVAISFAMTNTYRAKIVLAPVQDEEFGGGMGGDLGGIAAIAGGLGIGGLNSRKAEYFATLTSDGFARDFIVKENLMPILFPKSWDAQAGRWRAGITAPTLEAGVRKFSKTVLFAKEDHNSGLVTVNVDWPAQDLVAIWANKLVDMVNDRLRQAAMRTAESSIDYLNAQLARNNTVELHQAISRLIEQQVDRAMMASVRRDYAYRIVDPAVRPDQRFRPQRPLIGAIGGAAALILALIYAYAMRGFRRKRARD